MKKETIKFLWIFFGFVLLAGGIIGTRSDMVGWNVVMSLLVGVSPYIGAAFLAWGLSHY